MHQIEGLYHLSHCVGDLEEADVWYKSVLGGDLLFGNSHEEALRRASFWVVGGNLWEVLTPMDSDAGRAGPIGRFHERFGDRMHSVGFWVEDLVGSARHLEQSGIRFFDVAGRTIGSADVTNDGVLFTHPKDSFGMVELAGPDCTPECRIAPVKVGQPSQEPGQLQVLGIREVTVTVSDLDAAVARLSTVLGAPETERGEQQGCRSAYLNAGNVVVEVRQPVEENSIDMQWLSKNGEGASGATLIVADIGAASEQLVEHGQEFWPLGDDTVRLDPRCGMGVSYQLTSVRSVG